MELIIYFLFIQMGFIGAYIAHKRKNVPGLISFCFLIFMSSFFMATSVCESEFDSFVSYCDYEDLESDSEDSYKERTENVR